MKRQIKSADSIVHMSESKKAKARQILNLASELFYEIEGAPDEIFDEYDPDPLRAELDDAVYYMAQIIDGE